MTLRQQQRTASHMISIKKCQRWAAEFAPLEDEEIWFNNKGIANVLSMAKIVDRGNDVVYDSRKEDAFIACSKKGGYPIKFKRWNNLYAMFPTETSDIPQTDYQFVETAEENEKMHSARDVQRAKIARNACQAAGGPSMQDFKHMIHSNVIKDCPITLDAIHVQQTK